MIPVLREAAKLKDPWKILARAAAAFNRARLSVPGFSREMDLELGRALADLAVTGRMAYERFQRTPGFLRGAIYDGFRASFAQAGTLPADTQALLLLLNLASPAEFATAVDSALDRAFTVAWALRGPTAQRAALRPPLKWIAASGEDDSPHRPVNVAQPDFEQFDIAVTVPGRGISVGGFNLPAVTVQTRYFIASAVDDPAPAIAFQNRAVPPDPVPHIPDGHQVILFLHGHSSSADEACDIIPHIHRAGLDCGIKYSIVSLDLPNSGYSKMFDHTRVAASDATTYPAGVLDHTTPIQTPILDYIEDFIVAFVDALDLKTPVKNRFAGVIGGSLGGNLGLRLGRRGQLRVTQGGTDDSPWLKAGIVSWSAASVWPPLVNNEALRMGPDGSMLKSKEAETDLARVTYFSRVYDKSVADGTVAQDWVRHAQPYYWYRNDWEPCKSLHIQASRTARQEIYNANFRQWHWRLAGEQVIYSHIDRLDHHHNNNPQNSNPYRYELNKVRQLLVAGQKDDEGLHIYSSTRDLAAKMLNTPGRSLFLKDTGHSIQFERPHYLAGEIVKFLGTAPQDVSFLVPLLLSGP